VGVDPWLSVRSSTLSRTLSGGRTRLGPQRERDEFERIELTARLQRARDSITQGLAFNRRQVEDIRYELGRLDERLRGERS
jgi:hypothetical protein